MSENMSSDFSRLFSDPSALSSLASLIRTMNAGAPDANKVIEAAPADNRPVTASPSENSTDFVPQQTASEDNATASDDISVQRDAQNSYVGGSQELDPLSAMLANPEILAKLPQIISAARPILSSLQSSRSQTPALDASNPRSSASASQSANSSPHTLLLSALKPYLSQSRQDALDGIVRITGLMEVMRMLRPPENK